MARSRKEPSQNMLVSLPVIILLLVAIGVPPTRMSRKYIKIHWWDYALPAAGMPVWILLTAVEVGQTASLSNLVVEGFWILVASVLTPWTRLLVLKGDHRYTSLIFNCMYTLPVITAVLLRLNMPTLPE